MPRITRSLLLSAALLSGCSAKEDPRPSQIVFSIDRSGTKSDLLLVDPQGGGEPLPVAGGEAEDETPAWAPDGLTLIFASKRDGHYGLYTWEKKLEMLAGANYKDIGPTWSGNGRRIAYMSNRDNTWQIYSIGASGKEEKRLTNTTSNDTWPAWSPDGSTILFQSDRGGQQDLYVMQVLPAEAEPNPKPGPKGEAPPVLKYVDEAKAVTNDRAWDGKPAWSPDGKFIAWPSAREGKSAIYIMEASGKNARRLTPLDSEADEPTWSPDGKRIAFISNRDGFRELYVVNVDGSGAKRLTYQRGILKTPAWSPFLPSAK